jgi:hypothetical protein
LSLDYIDYVVEAVDAFQAVVLHQLLSANSRLSSPLFQNVGFVSGEEAAMTDMDAVDLWTTVKPFAYFDLARAQGGRPPPTPPTPPWHAHFHPYSKKPPIRKKGSNLKATVLEEKKDTTSTTTNSTVMTSHKMKCEASSEARDQSQSPIRRTAGSPRELRSCSSKPPGYRPPATPPGSPPPRRTILIRPPPTTRLKTPSFKPPPPPPSPTKPRPNSKPLECRPCSNSNGTHASDHCNFEFVPLKNSAALTVNVNVDSRRTWGGVRQALCQRFGTQFWELVESMTYERWTSL